MVMTSEGQSRFLFGASMLVLCYGRTDLLCLSVVCLFACLIALTRTNTFFRYTYNFWVSVNGRTVLRLPSPARWSWHGMGWDGMGWDGMGWDGMALDGFVLCIDTVPCHALACSANAWIQMDDITGYCLGEISLGFLHPCF